MNTICPQCGTVLASGEQTCIFCDSPKTAPEPGEAASVRGNLALQSLTLEEWKGELNQRLEAYRARRRKNAVDENQSILPFDNPDPGPSRQVAVETEDAVREKTVPADDFAFTIAIGRIKKKPEEDESRLTIDVTVPPAREESALAPQPQPELPAVEPLYPIASLDERKRALVIDIACLLFAYGGFLALFGSLGGHFAFNKLSAAVCFFNFAFVYLQYFGLFTVFGGSTPGMMVSGLQVASFTGDQPTSRQYLLRAIGYVLSAGTCFLGFLWVLWDEDGLTWHDRLSETYLARTEPFGEEEASQPAAVR